MSPEAKARVNIDAVPTAAGWHICDAANPSIHAAQGVALREEFGKRKDFAQKITYRTTGETLERPISAFRNSDFSRIAVTVDMIATRSVAICCAMTMSVRWKAKAASLW